MFVSGLFGVKNVKLSRIGPYRSKGRQDLLKNNQGHGQNCNIYVYPLMYVIMYE